MDTYRPSPPRKWFLVIVGAAFVFVLLPFLAPVFMHFGWDFPARVIYFVYSFLCHQLPQRSFFLFGQQFTYPMDVILRAYGLSDPNNIFLLRKFIGNSQLGWKVAWSDRMVSMYSSIPLFALIWYPLRRRIPKLPLWGFVILLLPMALDGGTHFISDIQGMGAGFRYTNMWLSTITHNAFPSTFYAGDAWGSFNSIMRLVTGILFGLGLVWYGFPSLEEVLS